MKTTNLIFLGPPGSGKGTYSRRIAPEFNLAYISTGDLLRERAKTDSALKAFLATGQLFPDEKMLELLKERLKQPDCKNGVVFDGFPRTLPQAEGLGKILKIDLVVNLILPDSIIIKKTLGRRTCSKCGDPSYNLETIDEQGICMPPLLPKVPGKCDKCSGELIQRADDTEEIIRNRLKVYWNQTAPLIEYYKNKKALVEYKVHDEPNTVVPEISQLIKKNLE